MAHIFLLVSFHFWSVSIHANNVGMDAFFSGVNFVFLMTNDNLRVKPLGGLGC